VAEYEESLFLRSLEDLEKRIEAKDSYEVLGISGIIRRLLLDSHPLVDRVNRRYQRRLVFRVNLPPVTPAGLPEPVISATLDGLHPGSAPWGPLMAELNREQFLKVVLITIAGRDYTVRDVLLFEANVMGAVHAGRPKDDKEKALQAVDSWMSVGGYRPALKQLKDIGRVVIDALELLREDVSRTADG